MRIEIGTGLVSWGIWHPSDPKQMPWERCLNEIAQAGYAWTELGPPGYLPTDPEVLGAELRKRNLGLCGGDVMRPLEDRAAWSTIETETLHVCENLAANDAKFLVLIDDFYTSPIADERYRTPELDGDAWRRLIEQTHTIARIARERFELSAVFHPHAETHVQTEEQIERLLAETDSALVGLCLDIGHHAYVGGDPIAFMRRHHQRTPYLHLKNVDPDVLDRAARERLPFADAVAQDVFVEPAVGVVDFPAFLEVLQEGDYDGWAVVEQDLYPAPPDKPLPIATRTRAHLRSIGYG